MEESILFLDSVFSNSLERGGDRWQVFNSYPLKLPNIGPVRVPLLLWVLVFTFTLLGLPGWVNPFKKPAGARWWRCTHMRGGHEPCDSWWFQRSSRPRTGTSNPRGRTAPPPADVWFRCWLLSPPDLQENTPALSREHHFRLKKEFRSDKWVAYSGLSGSHRYSKERKSCRLFKL